MIERSSGPRLGSGLLAVVEHQPFDRRAEFRDEPALAAGFHAFDDVGGQLLVPGVVEFAGLHHRPRRRSRVAAALERHLAEMRLAFQPEPVIGGIDDHVVRLELVHHEGAGADRVEIGLGTGRGGGAETVGELRCLQNRALETDKGHMRIWGGGVEGDDDGLRVGRLDRSDAVELGLMRTAAFGMGAIIVGELDVGRGQRRAVGPCDAGRELPGDLGQILAHPAIFDGWDLVDQPGGQNAALVKSRQRLEHQPGGFGILAPTR